MDPLTHPQAIVAPLASRHLAFVIGCNAYQQHPPLAHCVRDARAVAHVLSNKGYFVVRCEDVELETFLFKFAQFMASISAGSMVVFYFSGHGCQVNGTNYLSFPGADCMGGSGVYWCQMASCWNPVCLGDIASPMFFSQMLCTLWAILLRPFATNWGACSKPRKRAQFIIQAP